MFSNIKMKKVMVHIKCTYAVRSFPSLQLFLFYSLLQQRNKTLTSSFWVVCVGCLNRRTWRTLVAGYVQIVGFFRGPANKDEQNLIILHLRNIISSVLNTFMQHSFGCSCDSTSELNLYLALFSHCVIFRTVCHSSFYLGMQDISDR